MTDPLDVAEEARRICIEAALEAFEDAGIQGLCFEGRWERAIDAMRHVDLTRIRPVRSAPEPPGSTE